MWKLFLIFVLSVSGNNLLSQVVSLEKAFVSEPFGSELSLDELKSMSGTWKISTKKRKTPDALDKLFGDELQPAPNFWEDLYFAKVVDDSTLVVGLLGWAAKEQTFKTENLTVFARKFNKHVLLFFELDLGHLVFATCSIQNGVGKICVACPDFFHKAISDKRVSGSLVPMMGITDELKLHTLIEPTDQVLAFIEENFKECFSSQRTIFKQKAGDVRDRGQAQEK